ncbi:MAG: hypothetical protein IKZ45_08570 [Fibrobacter sp.]|jgi:hypothetical protein|nr:hypothetical protein [Fibrobacter sp.]
MKKLYFLSALLIPLMFTACGQKDGTESYIGYWQSDANTIFEVLTENGEDYIIRNIYGDLTAKVEDGALRGKNNVDMDYSMRVKGDSAYYLFADITTGYKRITKDEYDRIFATLSKPAIQ